MTPSDLACQAPDHRLISLQSTCLIAAWLHEQQQPIDPVLAGSGLSPSDLQTPARLITPEQEQQVFANTVALAGDPLVGLKLGQRMRVSAYGQLGYAMLSAPTLLDALQVMLAFPVLLGSYFRLQLESLPDGLLALRADHYHEAPALQLFNVELCLSSIKAMLDDALGRPLPLQAVHLSGELPAHAEHYPDFFGTCPVQVGQSAERLVFAADALQASLPLAEPVTHFEAVRHCRSVQDSFRPEASPLISQLSAQLEQQLDAPPSLEQLAAQLHCTSRTLGAATSSCSTACAFSAPSCCSTGSRYRSMPSPSSWASARPPVSVTHFSAGQARRHVPGASNCRAPPQHTESRHRTSARPAGVRFDPLSVPLQHFLRPRCAP
jgi:hypothetical protein